MRTVVISMFFLILISSSLMCRKEKAIFDGVNCTGNCFILTGKLIDSATNAGLSNAEIKFYYREGNGFTRTTSFLGKTFSDNGGNYTFRFDGTGYKNNRGYFYAEAYKENYFHDPFYGNRFPAFYLDSTLFNIPSIKNYSLYRPATLNVRVIASSVTSSQSLEVSYNYGQMGNGIVLNGGRPIDTTLSFKTAGDIRTFISADIRSVGFSNSKRDTVMISSNTTRNVEIRF